MIPSLLQPPPTQSDQILEPEDIFTSTIGTLFTDEYKVQHGYAGSDLIYTSSAFGDIVLKLPNPSQSQHRDLFAHYVWNSGILLAEGIGNSWKASEEAQKGERGDYSSANASGERSFISRRGWMVKGKKVCELGAGSGALSIVCHLAGAEEVVCTDYPSSDILDTVRLNLVRNVGKSGLKNGERSDDEEASATIRSRDTSKADDILAKASITVHGHKWGSFHDEILEPRKHEFDIVMAADTLWLGVEHETLLSSFEFFLKDSPTAEGWIVAGFHTGRAEIAGFLDLVRDGPPEESVYKGGLKLAAVWEVDVDGHIRDWVEERPGENITNWKRWSIVIVLQRR